MGLDTSHGCWHGAYSAFTRWRTVLAQAAGIPLWLMEGYYAPPEADLIARTAPRAFAFSVGESGGFVATKDSLTSALADAAERGDAGRWEAWSSKFRDALPLQWEMLKPDPLHALLDHSDCEGSIAASDCAPLADRLEELLSELPAEDDPGHIGNWRAKTETFIAGLRLAASKNEDVEFH